MKSLSKLIASCVLLFSANSIAGSFLLNHYNLVTIEDISARSLHVGGTAVVGGDIDANNSLIFGQDLNNPEISLILGGELTGNISQVDADGIVYVDDSNSIGRDQNGALAVNGITFTETDTLLSRELSNVANIIEDNLTSASDAFRNLEANSEFVESNSQQTQISLGDSLGANDIAVLELDINDSVFTNSPNQQLELSSSITGSVESVIINVSGVNITSLAFLGATSDSATNVLFNFYEAETITLNRQFYGSILAPFATLTQTGGDIDGSVGVLAIGANHGGEIHNDLTTVSIPETPETPVTREVPEPSTWLLFAGIALALFRFRKR